MRYPKPSTLSAILFAIALLIATASQAFAQYGNDEASFAYPPVPDQSVLVPTPAAPEAIATPQPNLTPAQPYLLPAPAPVLPAAPLVLERRVYATPVVRWGFFRLRLVPRTVYSTRWVARPARVVGPFYELR